MCDQKSLLDVIKTHPDGRISEDALKEIAMAHHGFDSKSFSEFIDSVRENPDLYFEFIDGDWILYWIGGEGEGEAVDVKTEAVTTTTLPTLPEKPELSWYAKFYPGKRLVECGVAEGATEIFKSLADGKIIQSACNTFVSIRGDKLSRIDPLSVSGWDGRVEYALDWVRAAFDRENAVYKEETIQWHESIPNGGILVTEKMMGDNLISVFLVNDTHQGHALTDNRSIGRIDLFRPLTDQEIENLKRGY